MSNLSRFQKWVEDHLDWYDRTEERQKHERTQKVRQRSIDVRVRAEQIMDHRVERLIRVGRVDAEIDALRAKGSR